MFGLWTQFIASWRHSHWDIHLADVFKLLHTLGLWSQIVTYIWMRHSPFDIHFVEVFKLLHTLTLWSQFVTYIWIRHSHCDTLCWGVQVAEFAGMMHSVYRIHLKKALTDWHTLGWNSSFVTLTWVSRSWCDIHLAEVFRLLFNKTLTLEDTLGWNRNFTRYRSITLSPYHLPLAKAVISEISLEKRLILDVPLDKTDLWDTLTKCTHFMKCLDMSYTWIISSMHNICLDRILTLQHTLELNTHFMTYTWIEHSLFYAH